MATRQDTNKSQEQTRTATEQSKQPDQQTKPEQTKPEEQNRPSETGMTPHRSGGAINRAGGWEPFARLRDEFDRFFDRVSRGMLGMPNALGESGWGIDMKEDDDKLTIRAEAPGFESSDFDIQVHGDHLVMRATHKSKNEEEGGYRGWRRNEFYEAIRLPGHVDAEKVKASYRNGVLTVTIPKSEGSKARRIKVEG